MFKVAKKKGSFGSGFRKFVDKSRKHYNANPAGLKLLCALLGLSALFFIALALLMPELAFKSIVAGAEISSWPAYAIKVSFTILLVLLAFGLNFRRKWAYDASMVAFGAMAVNSYMTLAAPNLEFFNLIAEFVMIGSIAGIFINLASIWYLIEIKMLFKAGRFRESKLVEKVYKSIYVMFGFFFLVLLLGVFFQMAGAYSAPWDDIRELVKTSQSKEAYNLCSDFSGDNAEACQLSAIVYNPKAFYTTSAEKVTLCGNFKGVVYRLACLKVVS